jgi:hypothetical protein
MTPTQRRALQDAERMPRFGLDGITAKGRRRAVQALVAAGLLRDAGLGAECDGDGYAVVPERWATVYEITDAGRAALASPTPESDDR